MEVNVKSLESLQAYGYRLLASIEASQRELQRVNELIINFKEETPVEVSKTKEK